MSDGKPEFKDFTHTSAVEKPRPTRRRTPEPGETED